LLSNKLTIIRLVAVKASRRDWLYTLNHFEVGCRVGNSQLES
jgi:hypothetical protein